MLLEKIIIARSTEVIQFYQSECSTVEALEAATLHPACALGISDRKGSLLFGRDADFVILDHDLNVVSTWIASQKVYQNPAAVELTSRRITKQ